VRGLTVANLRGFGPDPLLDVEEAHVRVRLLPLLRGRLQFGEVTLSRPRVVVEQGATGAWNLPAPGSSRPAPAAPLVLISRVRLRQGQLELRLPGEPGRPVVAHLVDRIDVTLDDLGWSQPIRFALGARLPGGAISLEVDGQVGPLAAAGADLAALPAQLVARFTSDDAHARPTTTALAITGKGEGEIRVEGRLGNLGGGGRLRFARLTLTHQPAGCPGAGPRSLLIEGLDLPVEVRGPDLAVRPFALRLAGGTMEGEAALSFRAATPGVQLTGVRAVGVATEPVLVQFLCQPYAVTGRIDAQGDFGFAGVGDALLRSAQGQWQIRVGPGRLVGPAALKVLSGVVQVGTAVYSLVTLDAPRALAGSPLAFDSLTARGTVGGSQLRVADLAMLSRDLRVGGGGTYGLLDTRLDFLLNVQAGRAGFAVKVGGTAQAPTYAPEAPRAMLTGLADCLAPLTRPRNRAPEGSSGGAPAR
jgi:uncharacterized protein involved in outer membrane biogenesis